MLLDVRGHHHGLDRLEALKAVRLQYYRDKQGLEQPEFTAVRSQLDDYLARLHYAGTIERAGSDPTLLDNLAMRLARYEIHPTREDSLVIGELLEYLEMTGSATPELDDTVKSLRLDGWVKKPFTLPHMLNLVEQVIDQRGE